MIPQFWAGSEDSYHAFLAALAKGEAYAARMKPGEEPVLPPLYTRQGSVGIVTIAGSLIPGEAGYLRLFGINGYDDIKGALLEGLKDSKAKSLMLVSSSNGGAVDGVSDAARLIRQVGEHKPLSAYASRAASAAYWLTSAADHITLASTGIAGSIGILRVHSEGSKADAKDGITITLLRAGKYKALLNPYEALTEDAKAEEQSKLDYLYNIFVSDVAANRSTSNAVVDQMMGQGRTFIGTQAVDAGLVDMAGSLQDALAYAKTNKVKRKPANVSSAVARPVAATTLASNNAANPSKDTEMLIEPTAQELAALAGVSGDEDETALAADASSAEDAVAASAELVTAQEQASAAQAQVVEMQAQLDAAAAAATSLQAELADALATIAGLLPAVQASVKALAVPLNKKITPADLSASDLSSTYAEYAAAYATLFKTSRPAKAAAEPTPVAPEVKPSRVDHAFRLAAQSLK